MPRYTEEQRQALKRAIKWSLFSEPISKFCNGEGRLKAWFLKHIAGNHAFKFTSKNGLDKKALHWIDLMCNQRFSRNEIAWMEGIQVQSVEQAVDRVLYKLVDLIPFGLARGVIKITPEWRLKGCERCKGDQHREKDGLIQGRHCWKCLLCGHEEEIKGI